MRKTTFLIATSVLFVGGCYLSFGREGALGMGDASQPSDGRISDGATRDSATDAQGRNDAGTGDADAGTSDLGIDAELDLGRDLGASLLDSGLPVDAGEPPIEGPPTSAGCRVEPPIYPFENPVMEYRWPDGPVAIRPDAVHVCATPLVVDVDAPGASIDPELVFISYGALSRDEEPGVLRIVRPRTHETLTVPNREGDRGVFEPTSHVAAGDLDGDGRVEIVGIGTASATYAVHADGTPYWDSAYPTALERGNSVFHTIGGATSIADLDADGHPEVIVGRTVLDGRTGHLLWEGTGQTGQGINNALGPLSCVADLDNDGLQEVIAGPTAWHADGRVMWNRRDTIPDGFCAIADMVPTSRGPEVVLAASGYVRVLSGQTGEPLFIRRLVGQVMMPIGGAPTVADFDADGRPEIGIAHGAAYGVYDLDCTGLGTPAGCADEGLLWQAPTADDSSSGTGSSVFDFNGDGSAEVVYNDQYFFRVYSGRTGTPLFAWRNSSRTRTENPVVADADNDGDAEIVFSANAEAFFIRDGFTDPGVEIWGEAQGRWVGARRIWNQHAYHITNVTERGAIPTRESPSWTTLNAYRQNIREGGDVLVTPDLWTGRVNVECAGSTGRFIVDVGNYGLERIGEGVVVALYRGDPASGGLRVAEARTTTVLEPGGHESVRIETAIPLPVVDYWVVLDDPEDVRGGTVDECREGNNRRRVWRPYCGS